MKLLTKEIIEELKKYPLYSQQPGGDWLFFGKVHILETEWGYFTLSELESVKLPDGQPQIERDLYYSGEEEI